MRSRKAAGWELSIHRAGGSEYAQLSGGTGAHWPTPQSQIPWSGTACALPSRCGKPIFSIQMTFSHQFAWFSLADFIVSMENIPEQPTSIPMAACTCSTRSMLQSCAVCEPAAWCWICPLWKNLFCCLIVLSQMFLLTSTALMSHSHRGNWPPRIKHSCGRIFFPPT